MAWRQIITDQDIATATPQAVQGSTGSVGTSDKYAREDHVHALGPLTANLDAGSQKITSLTDPTAAQDAATKNYVDAQTAGVTDVKDSVRAATTGNITLSGEQTIDGVSIVSGNRVLVKDQTTGADNGIYVCATSSWSRSSDADSDAEVTAGLYVWVEEGTAHADSGWLLTTDNPITLGTTSLTFTQVSSLGQVTAGDGLSKSGSTLSVNVDNSSIEISADTLRVKASGVTNDMLAGSIANTKLATNPLDRANHTGTQLASTISDFDTQVQTNRLDQLADPAADLNFANYQVAGLRLKNYTTAGLPSLSTEYGVLVFDTDVVRPKIWTV